MKRRLMVLFLSLSAATVFAAGQKEKPPHGAAFFFIFFRARAPAGRRAFRCNSQPPCAFSPRQSCRFALRRLSVGRSFPLQSLAPSAALTAVCESAAFKAVFCAFSCNFRSRPAAVFEGPPPSTQRFDSGRISGLLRICRLQGSILCLFLQFSFPPGGGLCGSAAFKAAV